MLDDAAINAIAIARDGISYYNKHPDGVDAKPEAFKKALASLDNEPFKKALEDIQTESKSGEPEKDPRIATLKQFKEEYATLLKTDDAKIPDDIKNALKKALESSKLGSDKEEEKDKPTGLRLGTSDKSKPSESKDKSASGHSFDDYENTIKSVKKHNDDFVGKAGDALDEMKKSGAYSPEMIGKMEAEFKQTKALGISMNDSNDKMGEYVKEMKAAGKSDEAIAQEINNINKEAFKGQEDNGVRVSGTGVEIDITKVKDFDKLHAALDKVKEGLSHPPTKSSPEVAAAAPESGKTENPLEAAAEKLVRAQSGINKDAPLSEEQQKQVAQYVEGAKSRATADAIQSGGMVDPAKLASGLQKETADMGAKATIREAAGKAASWASETLAGLKVTPKEAPKTEATVSKDTDKAVSPESEKTAKSTVIAEKDVPANKEKSRDGVKLEGVDVGVRPEAPATTARGTPSPAPAGGRSMA